LEAGFYRSTANGKIYESSVSGCQAFSGNASYLFTLPVSSSSENGNQGLVQGTLGTDTAGVIYTCTNDTCYPIFGALYFPETTPATYYYHCNMNHQCILQTTIENGKYLVGLPLSNSNPIQNPNEANADQEELYADTLESAILMTCTSKSCTSSSTVSDGDYLVNDEDFSDNLTSQSHLYLCQDGTCQLKRNERSYRLVGSSSHYYYCSDHLGTCTKIPFSASCSSSSEIGKLYLDGEENPHFCINYENETAYEIEVKEANANDYIMKKNSESNEFGISEDKDYAIVRVESDKISLNRTNDKKMDYIYANKIKNYVNIVRSQCSTVTGKTEFDIKNMVEFKCHNGECNLSEPEM